MKLQSRLLCGSHFGSRDGALARALASHQCGLGSIRARCHLSVEFDAGPRLALRVFLWVLWFFPLNNQHSKFQFDQDRLATRNPGKSDVASSRNLVIYRAKKVINFKFNILFLLISPEKWIWALPFHFRRSINVAQTHLARRTFFSTYCGVLLRIKKNAMWNHKKERPLGFHQEQRENNTIMRTERFSFESRKVIGYVSLCNLIGLKKTRHWK